MGVELSDAEMLRYNRQIFSAISILMVRSS